MLVLLLAALLLAACGVDGSAVLGASFSMDSLVKDYTLDAVMASVNVTVDAPPSSDVPTASSKLVVDVAELGAPSLIVGTHTGSLSLVSSTPGETEEDPPAAVVMTSTLEITNAKNLGEGEYGIVAVRVLWQLGDDEVAVDADDAGVASASFSVILDNVAPTVVSLELDLVEHTAVVDEDPLVIHMNMVVDDAVVTVPISGRVAFVSDRNPDNLLIAQLSGDSVDSVAGELSVDTLESTGTFRCVQIDLNDDVGNSNRIDGEVDDDGVTQAIAGMPTFTIISAFEDAADPTGLVLSFDNSPYNVPFGPAVVPIDVTLSMDDPDDVFVHATVHYDLSSEFLSPVSFDIVFDRTSKLVDAAQYSASVNITDDMRVEGFNTVQKAIAVRASVKVKSGLSFDLTPAQVSALTASPINFLPDDRPISTASILRFEPDAIEMYDLPTTVRAFVQSCHETLPAAEASFVFFSGWTTDTIAGNRADEGSENGATCTMESVYDIQLEATHAAGEHVVEQLTVSTGVDGGEFVETPTTNVSFTVQPLPVRSLTVAPAKLTFVPGATFDLTLSVAFDGSIAADDVVRVVEVELELGNSGNSAVVVYDRNATTAGMDSSVDDDGVLLVTMTIDIMGDSNPGVIFIRRLAIGDGTDDGQRIDFNEALLARIPGAKLSVTVLSNTPPRVDGLFFTDPASASPLAPLVVLPHGSTQIGVYATVADASDASKLECSLLMQREARETAPSPSPSPSPASNSSSTPTPTPTNATDAGANTTGTERVRLRQQGNGTQTYTPPAATFPLISVPLDDRTTLNGVTYLNATLATDGLHQRFWFYAATCRDEHGYELTEYYDQVTSAPNRTVAASVSIGPRPNVNPTDRTPPVLGGASISPVRVQIDPLDVDNAKATLRVDLQVTDNLLGLSTELPSRFCITPPDAPAYARCIEFTAKRLTEKLTTSDMVITGHGTPQAANFSFVFTMSHLASASGTWGIAEVTLVDKAGNTGKIGMTGLADGKLTGDAFERRFVATFEVDFAYPTDENEYINAGRRCVSATDPLPAAVDDISSEVIFAASAVLVYETGRVACPDSSGSSAIDWAASANWGCASATPDAGLAVFLVDYDAFAMAHSNGAIDPIEDVAFAPPSSLVDYTRSSTKPTTYAFRTSKSGRSAVSSIFTMPVNRFLPVDSFFVTHSAIWPTANAARFRGIDGNGTNGSASNATTPTPTPTPTPAAGNASGNATASPTPLVPPEPTPEPTPEPEPVPVPASHLYGEMCFTVLLVPGDAPSVTFVVGLQMTLSEFEQAAFVDKLRQLIDIIQPGSAPFSSTRITVGRVWQAAISDAASRKRQQTGPLLFVSVTVSDAFNSAPSSSIRDGLFSSLETEDGASALMQAGLPIVVMAQTVAEAEAIDTVAPTSETSDNAADESWVQQNVALVAGIAGVVIVCGGVIIFCLCCRKRGSKKDDEDEEMAYPYPTPSKIERPMATSEAQTPFGESMGVLDPTVATPFRENGLAAAKLDSLSSDSSAGNGSSGMMVAFDRSPKNGAGAGTSTMPSLRQAPDDDDVSDVAVPLDEIDLQIESDQDDGNDDDSFGKAMDAAHAERSPLSPPTLESTPVAAGEDGPTGETTTRVGETTPAAVENPAEDVNDFDAFDKFDGAAVDDFDNFENNDAFPPQSS